MTQRYFNADRSIPVVEIIDPSQKAVFEGAYRGLKKEDRLRMEV